MKEIDFANTGADGVHPKKKSEHGEKERLSGD
jgi:hypothetical protein